jgi:hypothetical protein
MEAGLLVFPVSHSTSGRRAVDTLRPRVIPSTGSEKAARRHTMSNRTSIMAGLRALEAPESGVCVGRRSASSAET